MNKEICNEVMIDIEKYLTKSITAKELSGAMKLYLDSLDGISDAQRNTIRYYEELFEKEGSVLYHRNKYIDEEISELKEFLNSL